MGIFDRVLRAGEGRKVKALQSLVPDINSHEAEISRLSDDALRAKTGRVPQSPRQRRRPRRPPGRSICGDARSGAPRHRPAPLRRAAHGRRGAAPRLGRRDEDRRRQDARVDAARVSQRLVRARAAHLHGQRLPGHSRCQLDGPDPSLARSQRGSHHAGRARQRAQARAVRVRHHLRHQQRARLRLPARQHGHVGSRTRCSAATSIASSTKSTRS